MSSEARVSRRGLLLGAGASSLLAIANRPVYAQTPSPSVDHTIRIAPISLEIGPNKVIQTTGYNGKVPGPPLRLKEGKQVAINVINDSGYPNLIHWHGLFIPPLQDGAVEEGSPIIPPGESLLYSFTPKPSGTRWYHSHAMAMTDCFRASRRLLNADLATTFRQKESGQSPHSLPGPSPPSRIMK